MHLSGQKGLVAEDREIRDPNLEIDEVYLDGNEEEQARRQETECRYGNCRKSVVVGAKDRDTGQVSAQVVPDTTKETLHTFIEERADSAAIVYIDGPQSLSGHSLRP